MIMQEHRMLSIIQYVHCLKEKAILHLLTRNIVGYVLLDEYIFERICRSDGANGCVRKQTGYIETLGNPGWRCIGLVVYLPLVLLKLGLCAGISRRTMAMRTIRGSGW